MAKAKFERTKPHVNVGTIGHVDHGKTTLTAAITKVLSLKGMAQFKAYDQIDAAPEEKAREDNNRDGTRRVRDGQPSLCARGLPWPCRLRQEHDHRAQRNGRSDSGSIGRRRSDAADQRAHTAGATGWRTVHRRIHEQVRHGRRPELLDLVELEVRELLSKYQFPGNDIPVIRGSALKAMESGSNDQGVEEYKCILELMDAVDAYVPTPERPIDKPFLMPIEDVFTISGRGTVVTGRVERGIIKVGEEDEIVGIRETRKTTVTGVEMFRKLLDEGRAGDNVGNLLRGIGKEDVERGMVLAKPGKHHPAHQVQGRSIHSDEGRRRPSHPVL